MLLGVWIVATAAVYPLLVLAKPEATALTWSLIAAAYSFTTAVILQAITGVRAISPEGGLATRVAFTANIIAVLSAFLGAALTLMGASNGLRESSKRLPAPAME